jgi:hypothetical protein
MTAKDANVTNEAREFLNDMRSLGWSLRPLPGGRLFVTRAAWRQLGIRLTNAQAPLIARHKGAHLVELHREATMASAETRGHLARLPQELAGALDVTLARAAAAYTAGESDSGQLLTTIVSIARLAGQQPLFGGAGHVTPASPRSLS